jgi:hypothetical protein
MIVAAAATMMTMMIKLSNSMCRACICSKVHYHVDYFLQLLAVVDTMTILLVFAVL